LALAAVVLIAVVGGGLLIGLGRSFESEKGTRPAGRSVADAGAAQSASPADAGETNSQETTDSMAATADTVSTGGADAIGQSETTSRPPHGEADAPAGPPALPGPLPPPADAAAADEAGGPARGERSIPPIGIADLDLDLSAGGGNVASSAPSSEVVESLLPLESVETSQFAEIPPEPPASSRLRMTIARSGEDDSDQVAADPSEPLALPLVELDLSKTSAVEAVRLVAELTGTPITITPEAYRILQAATGATMARQTQTTAGDVLAELLKPLGLHVEVREMHLVVAPNVSPPESTTTAENGPLGEKLQQTVTFTFTAPTPLADVLRHLERSSGLTLLVDWQSLSKRKLTPTSLITASVVDQPLGDVLDGLLPQLGIGSSPLGEAAVWITAQ
jgi:hypothetical protein